MGVSCFLLGEIGNELAKLAKLAIANGMPVTTIDSVESLIHNGVGAENALVFLASSVDDESAKRLARYRVVVCGDAQKYSNINALTHLGFPISSTEVKKLFDSFSGGLLPVCEDIKSRNILEVCKKIALTNASVLITGESGTGKEVITRFIHQHSNRSKNSFVAVNCAAIPDNLLESELFGHEKGAFTGAITQHIGKFEEAHNGTLFLDEISEMSQHLQAKLLRAVQEKEICRLGGNKTIHVNCRIIASSNRDLIAYVREMKFRADLYYRLNVINLEIPPLRERKRDIIALAEYFLEKYCEQNRVPVKKLSEAAFNDLVKYSWPGNVRELENAIHRSVILESGRVLNDIYGVSNRAETCDAV